MGMLRSSFLLILTFGLTAGCFAQTPSVARQWNEVQLFAIRNDFARPPVHARNLWHVSIAMYDAWAAYDPVASTFILGQTVGSYTAPFDGISPPTNLDLARNEAISYAAYRVLSHRFQFSPGASVTLPALNALMADLGYDANFTSTDYASGNPAALGNYIAEQVINFGFTDGSNEQGEYTNSFYLPVNEPLDMTQPGNPSMSDPNRWQPLELPLFIDQAGNPFTEAPAFQSPEWGYVTPFALSDDDLNVYNRDGFDWPVYLDPGPPPLIDTLGPRENDDLFRLGFAMVSVWQSHLDPEDGVLWDISPGAIGNLGPLPTNPTDILNFYNYFDGGDNSPGHEVNPATGLPYPPQWVPRGDYGRILAEYWADGPDSETPPGHWYTILNYVTDHPEFQPQWMGEGMVLDPLEWDVKSYFTLGGAVHDAAIAAWSVKGWFDYVRPVSAIRYMADRGQNSDPTLPSYHVAGIPLLEGYIELVDEGDPLAGDENENVGKIKLFTWRGPDYIEDPAVDVAGVGWILAENWWPYQRPTFVTPPFAGYVSGHSTFSRAAAEALTLITGDPYFPGGVGEFPAPENAFLVFEAGPSTDITLQWATYRDASDQCSLSRIWGGIHPPADDIPGRLMGLVAGQQAVEKANTYFTSGLPSVTSITASQAAVNLNLVGDVFQLSIGFDQPMNTSVHPLLTYTSDNPLLNTLTFESAEWPDDQTFEITYTVSNTNEWLTDIDVLIQGALNADGLEMVSSSFESVFSIDMIRPEANAVICADEPLNTSFFEQNYPLSIVFNEPMDVNVPVTVEIDALSEASDLINSSIGMGQWLNETTWEASFTINEVALDLEGFNIVITGAVDKAGNTITSEPTPAICLIDTRRPQIASIVPSEPVYHPASAEAPLELLISFDEAMNVTNSPLVSVSAPGDLLVLNASESGWLNDQQFNATMTDGGVPNVIALLSVTVGGVKDINGNLMSETELQSVFQLTDGAGVRSPSELPALIYPNPVAAGENLTVVYEGNAPVHISIMDRTGRLIEDGGLLPYSGARYTLHGLSAGWYIVKLRSGNRVSYQKIGVLGR